MKLGVNLWTVYGWRLAGAIDEEVLRALAAMGSQGVELVIDDQHNTADSLLARHPALSSVLVETGLEVPGIASTLFWRFNLASQDVDLRNRGLDLVQQGCRVAEKYGAQVLLVLGGQQEPNTEYQRTYATSVETLRQAGDYAADVGIVLGVENVLTNFLSSPREYSNYIADVDHPAVRAYLDFGNGMSVGPGYAENWVTAVRGQIAMVHAKDFDPGSKTYVCCGQGDVAWTDTFAALRSVGYDGYLLVETPARGGQRQPSVASGLEAAHTSLRWLQQFV
jgi:L-ribulose-5-phosphate 3-epimerase